MYQLCTLLSKKRDTNERLLEAITQDILRHSRSYQFEHKFQIVFMFAKNFYTLPEKYMECVRLFVDQIEKQAEKLQSDDGLGRLFGRYHLNYLWSLLVLDLDCKNSLGFRTCLDLFQKLALDNCKNSTNRYLMGLTGDIFLMLYKESEALRPEFVKAMLAHKHLWSKANELKERLPK